MIITISGPPGSGKSTVAKMLSEKLGWERIYVGGIRRELARKKGMTLDELNAYGLTHSETDVDVDKEATARARGLDEKGKCVVVEGRTQFYFLPESVKIYIKVSPEEGARRIWKDLQQQMLRKERNEGKINSFEQMKKSLQEREEEDAQRYKKYYKLDYHDESQFDLVIDSTKITPEEVAKRVLNYVKKKR